MKPTSWDPGLRTRRIQGYDATAPNYYCDTTDAGAGHYLIDVEAEKVFAHPAITGTIASQTGAVNDGGARTLTWEGDATHGYALNLVQDFVNHPSDAAGAYTSYTIHDDATRGGGPFPPIHRLFTRTNVLWDYYNPRGAARCVAGAGFNVGGYSVVAEINLNVSPNWETTGGEGPDIDGVGIYPTWAYVTLHGSGVGVVVPKGGAGTTIEIDWRLIANLLYARSDPKTGARYLPAPDWTTAVTYFTYFGMELRQDAAANAALGSFWVSGLTHYDTGA